jgi:uncharacterized damage-inducible protein DinB
MDFPEPSSPIGSRAEVFLTYLDYFRDRLIDKIGSLPVSELRSSRLPSGWSPLELLTHVRHVERRWLEWGFEGSDINDPWADQHDGKWFVPEDQTLADLIAALHDQAGRTRAIVESHDLADVGQPGPRWDGDEPPALERVLFHLLQEYARHVGHIDIVAEMAAASVGE